MLLRIALSFWTFFLFSNCTSSFIYSPSINLPPKPLQKGQLEVLGGFAFLPESRPQTTKSKTAFGGEATFRYAVCDHFSLQTKAWKDFSENVDASRSGISTSTIAMLNDSSATRYALISTAAFVFDREGLEGGGGGLRLGISFLKYNPVALYGAIGPAFGLRNLSHDNNEWGWGILGNFGISTFIVDRITVRFEAACIHQINKYDKRTDFLISPSINIGYLFLSESFFFFFTSF